MLRQSWSSHVRESPNFLQCELRSLFFLLSKRFLDATCRAQPRAGWKCIWERLDWNRITHCMFTSTAEQRNTQAVLKRTCQTGITLAYDSYPSSIGLPLAEDTCNISSNLSIDLTYHKCGVFRQSRSRHSRKPPNFFQCEVRRAPFLVCNPFLDAATCKSQVFHGKGCFETRSQTAHLQARTGEHSWITLAYDSHLSQDIRHCQKSFLSFVEEVLGCNLQGTATCRLKVYMGKARLKPDHTLHVYKHCGTEEYSGSLEADMSDRNHPGVWFLSQQHWSAPGRRYL